MISSKAIITYKRKRQFSQLKLTHGLNRTNSTPETQRIISLTRFSKKTEPGQFSEKQKGHDQKCIPSGKRLCTPRCEPHGSGKPVQQRSQEPKKARENNCLEEVEMGPITLRSQKVLQKLNCCENASNKSKDYSLQLDASFGKKPDSPSINLHSEVSGPNQAIARVEGSPDLQSNDMDLKRSRSASADSTIEESCEVACQQGFFSRTSSENNDLLFKVKSNVLCTDLNPKKFNVPLITFSRRAKRHRVNGTDAPKNVINEKRCSVVEWGNSAFTGSLHQRASQKCDSVDQSMAMAMPAMVQKINTLLVPGQDRQVKIVCKEEDRNLQYSSSGCASKTKIGHCSDEEQETQGCKLVGSPVAEGAQEKNSDQCLPSLHSRADDNVQECHCPFKCRETSSTDMTNETKQLGCSVAHLVGSVTPGSVNPIVTEQSCCKLSIGVIRSSEGLYFAKASSQSHPTVVQEETSDRARVLDLMEIPEQIVQEASYNRTLNDENLCPSTRGYGVKHEHTCNAKASSVLSKDMSVEDLPQQSLSTNILDEVVP